MSRWRIWILRLVLVVFVPALLLLLIEGVLRAVDFGVPTTFLVRRAIEGREWLVDNQYFGYRFFPPRMARTAQPLRFAARKPEGAIRIVVLGESAAMGDPLPEFGLARHLEAMLRTRFPGRRIEVINAAMTAINSHVIREIAADMMRCGPDAVVIYAGNNEVLGPYGPGTVLAPFAGSTRYARASVLAGRLRLAHAFRDALRRARQEGLEDSDWEGLRLFAQREVRADDPRLAVTYRAFEENLDAIVRNAQDARAKVVLSTVAVNVRDLAPFRSAHGPGVAEEARRRIDTCLSMPDRVDGDGQMGATIESLRDAVETDPRFAESHYRLARALLREGRAGEAAPAFERARDLDVLRFRADTRLNDIIRSCAARRQGVRLLDAEALMRTASPDGIPGDSLFVDHVHFNFHGNHLLAREAAEAVRDLFAGMPEASSTWMDEEEARRALTFGPWDEAREAEIMIGRMGQPPFIGQAEASNRVTALERRRDASRALSAGEPDGDLPAVYLHGGDSDPVRRVLLGFRYAERSLFEAAEQEFRSALRVWPHRFDLRAALAQVVARRGDYTEALKLIGDRSIRKGFFYGAICEDTAAKLFDARDLEGARIFCREAAAARPRDVSVRMRLAGLDEMTGHLGDAEAGYRWVIDRMPDRAELRARLGTVLAQQGKWDEALASQRRATELEPGNPSFRYDLAVMLLDQNRDDEAERELRRLLASTQADTFTYHQLGVIASRRGDAAGAAAHFDKAVALAPRAAPSLHAGGRAYASLGRFAEARDFFSRAVEADPDNLEYLNDYAWLLATCPIESLRDADGALRAAQRANTLAGGRQAAILDTLAAAWARSGRYDEAIQAARAAAAADPSPALKNGIATRLHLYTTGRAYEEPAPGPAPP